MRKRVNLPNQTDEVSADEVGYDMTPIGEKRVSVASLLSQLTPQERANLGIHCGYMMKRSSSLWLWLCPSLPDWLPTFAIDYFDLHEWKQRYFVLLGQYIYRFTDDQADHQKGCPIPIQATTPSLMRYVSSSDNSGSSGSSGNSTLPESAEPYCIYLSALRKTVTVKCSNDAECKDWIRAILNQKSLGIRQQLGHVAAPDKRIRELDQLAQEMYDSSVAREIREANATRRKAEGVLGQQLGMDESDRTADELAAAFAQSSATYSPMGVRSSKQ